MNHLPPPQRLGATQGEGPAKFAFAQGEAGGVLGGVVPSARVSERVGIPALPLAEDLPVHPGGAGFRFPQRKLFPVLGLIDRTPVGDGGRGRSAEESLMGEKFSYSFRLPRWEGKRLDRSSWRVES